MEIESNNIYNIDCIKGMKRLKQESVDMVLTDIPYNEVNREDNGLRTLTKDDADILGFNIVEFLDEMLRVVRGSVYIFCGIEQVSFLKNYLDKNGLSVRLLIWEKTNPSPLNGEHIWLSGIECCIYGKKPKATFNDNCRNTVLKYPNGKNKKHPTEKNIDLFMDLIKTSSEKRDIVLDPCIGSGTTAVASKKLNRKYIGFEVSEEYYKIAKKRVKNVPEKLSKWSK